MLWSFEKRDTMGYRLLPVEARTGISSNPTTYECGLLYPDQPSQKNRGVMGQHYLLPTPWDLHEYRVLKGTERIDGANCLVLEGRWKVSDKRRHRWWRK